MSYRERHRLVRNEVIGDFYPDLSKCRNKDRAIQIHKLTIDGLYSWEIARVVGCSPKTIQKFWRRYGYPDFSNICPPLLDERHDWKHGEKIMKGYLYRRTLDHPHGTKHGNYVAVHRLVMEEKLGRFLLPTEVVDHIDGDITNNHPDNLRVFASNGEHLAATRKGKVPNWSEDGRRRISESLKKRWEDYRADQASTSPDQLETCADR